MGTLVLGASIAGKARPRDNGIEEGVSGDSSRIYTKLVHVQISLLHHLHLINQRVP